MFTDRISFAVVVNGEGRPEVDTALEHASWLAEVTQCVRQSSVAVLPIDNKPVGALPYQPNQNR